MSSAAWWRTSSTRADGNERGKRAPWQPFAEGPHELEDQHGSDQLERVGDPADGHDVGVAGARLALELAADQ